MSRAGEGGDRKRPGSPGSDRGDASPEERIDDRYYDDAGYFEEGTDHLLDETSPFQRYRIRKVIELAEPRPEDRVVDLGCGWGTVTFALSPRVREVVGVDFARRSIELCAARKERGGGENVRFLRADAGETGLPSGAFDLVVAADLFEHLYPNDSERVVAEAWRLLAPGGRFAIWTPHRGHLIEILKNRGILLEPDPTHVDYKSMARLRRMLDEAGFEVERAYYTESHLPGIRLLERLLLRAVPFLRRRIAIRGIKG